MAGTLALCISQGHKVHLVCATAGEAGNNYSAPSSGPLELARIRTKELENSCASVGINSLSMLDWPDGKLHTLDQDRARKKLCTVLKENSPDVVITLGDDGVYGHKDHLVLTKLVKLAFNDACQIDSCRLLLCAFS
jgi:LmbE family N-acetylglucosaminyl deacetylase